jgi:uncharacterized protein YbcV (DUF1398 family)
MPLEPQSELLAPLFCTHCTTEHGELKPYREILQGTTDYLVSSQGLDQNAALSLAKGLLADQPAWRERLALQQATALFNREKIQEIAHRSKADQWPFPKTLNQLKAAGVDYYLVSLYQGDIVYCGDGEELKDTNEPALQGLPTIGTYDLPAIKAALAEHQQLKTPYAEVIKKLALAGVSSYRVDMHRRSCCYFGRNEGEKMVEFVPGHSE